METERIVLSGKTVMPLMCNSSTITNHRVIGKVITMIPIEHPGVMLKEDFLDDLGVKPGSFARAIGVDRAAIKKIIDGKRAILSLIHI